MPTLRIKRFKKTEPEGSGADVENSNLEPDQEMAVREQPSIESLIASNRKLARLSFYGIAFSLFLALCFSWMAGYYALALDAKISEQKTEFIRELDQRFRSYGIIADPLDRLPKELEIPSTAPVFGDESAPVTIVEYADFKCPYCQVYYNQVEKRLFDEYVKTGKAKYIYANFAFLGDESKQAGNASKCAQEQGKFWEYHELLFESQAGEDRADLSESKLVSLGRMAGVEISKFTSCVKEGRYLSVVEEETLAGRRSGVTGTPTVFINGTMIVGAQDYTAFSSVVDSALTD